MGEDQHTKIDIPESIEGYKLTLFWGLTTTQIILIFIATLFTGFGIFSLAARHFITMMIMFFITGLSLLAIVEIRGRNFYSHILFILSYYKSKPKVLIYNHYSTSGIATVQAKQLIYQKDNNNRIFIMIFVAIGTGLLLIILTAIYLYYVLHK